MEPASGACCPSLLAYTDTMPSGHGGGAVMQIRISSTLAQVSPATWALILTHTEL